jgi:chemotaxis protein methyltransferase CheR
MTAVKENKIAPGSDPVLPFLNRRIAEILGINAAPDALAKLKEYLESIPGSSPADLVAYDKLLSSAEGISAAARLVTINETYFFRESIHFKLLMRCLLPEFKKMFRSIRVCSAAVSTGCEAYSLAMLMDFYNRGKELFLSCSDISSPVKGRPFNYEIDAFDVNSAVVDYARNGRYTENAIREDGAEWRLILDIYLKKDGKEYKAAPFLRDKINFFTHNIMDGLTGPYDLIFFRNALIYFSPENRPKILDSLVNALAEGGFLIMGASETSSVEHPYLESISLPGVFYFRKKTPAQKIHGGENRAAYPKHEKIPPGGAEKDTAVTPPDVKAAAKKRGTVPADMREISALLEQEESRSNALSIAERLGQDGGSEKVTVSELIAAAVTLLGVEDFAPADRVISVLEETNNSAAASFLRGEYHYLNNDAETAEEKYQEASLKDKAFWPAFYRLSSLAARGNRTRYEYKIRKALESMDCGEEYHYETLIGGFSPDYYRHILEKNRLNRQGAE